MFNRVFALPIFLLVIANLSGCTSINWLFTKEVLNREPLSQIDRIALLDVPVPTEDELLNEITQAEMKNWLENAGKEVILVKANRKNKLKMLKDYDQFSQLDVDAVLEIAYYSLKMETDYSKKDKDRGLSPRADLKFRFVSVKDGQILVQSNVSYSGFEHNLAVLGVPGTRLLGPKEIIYYPSDPSSEREYSEGLKSLKETIKAVTESIAKVVTNSDRPLVNSKEYIDYSK